MSTKRRGLGRNLEALLGNAASGEAKQGPVAVGVPSGDSMRKLPVALLQPGKYQPRRDMHEESLDDLAASIKAQGVIQPVVVRPVGGPGKEGRYEIIAGERRWRAAQIAGLDEVPVVIRLVNDKAAIAMALIENIQREDLNPLEEANALQRLIDEFDLTHDEAASAVGRSRAAVSNLIRLRDLGPEVKKLVEGGKLEMGHARALLSLTALNQAQVAHQVVAKGLSVRETEALVKRTLAEGGKGGSGKKGPPPKDANIRNLEQELSEHLGAPVTIAHAKSGRGHLTIGYASLEVLDGVLEKLRR
jgi:ParB family chromosome partitioning protein